MRQLLLQGVRQNNLKNINLSLPLGIATVITGPSGSGKSSLAFETVYAEGQRRYMQSLSTYARQFLDKFKAPLLDHVENIPPTIALEQINPIRNSRATVGTSTEIYDYLRLLFEKIGQLYCSQCQIPMRQWTYATLASHIQEHYSDQTILVTFEKKFSDPATSARSILEEILRSGFSRILMKGNIEKLEDFLKETKTFPKSLHVIVDRLKIPPASEFETVQTRLTEALSTAQKLGLGEGKIYRADDIAQPPFRYTTELQCPNCSQKGPSFSALTFSFNSPLGACTECKGFGNILKVDPTKVIPNPARSILQGAFDPLTKPSLRHQHKKFINFCKENNIDTTIPYEDLSLEYRELLWKGVKKEKFPGIEGVFQALDKDKYKLGVRVFISRYQSAFTCETCHGSRLNSTALSIKLENKTIAEACELTLQELQNFLSSLSLSENEKKITQDIIPQLLKRLDYLLTVGLSYLTLARLTRTLSGGEYQRILLATQLSQGLTDTLYVLDEPSIGLHPKDTQQLLKVIAQLKALGNTLLIVEHDPEVIEWADHVIDMGPGSGQRGGQVIFSDSKSNFLLAETLTAQSVKQWRLECRDAILQKGPRTYEKWLEIQGARSNNLKEITVRIPLEALVCITGVSGSGKSTLIVDTLYPALSRLLNGTFDKPGKFSALRGYQYLSRVELVDQSPIGKTSRSNPATFIKAYDDIRQLFASTKAAKQKFILPGDFSFNVEGGRCDACEGEGRIKIDMQFMEDVYVPCETCQEKRFKPHVLAVQYEGKNIFDVLEMTVDEAAHFFRATASLKQKLSFLQQVGLGYLKLGQAGNSLSGGEAQRLKIAKSLGQPHDQKTIFILDEPTTGLHFSEVSKLISVFEHLIRKGHSVIVIEHNLQLISHADYLVDLGPEGGEAGGYVVAAGSPKQVAQANVPFTSSYLHQILQSK